MTTLNTLQSLMLPEQGLCTEPRLYLRLRGPAGLSDAQQTVEFAPGGRAGFGTYMNLFHLSRWKRLCGLTDLRLHLEGEGRFALVVRQALPDRSWERPISDVVTLSPEAPLDLDLSHCLASTRPGLLFFELTALEAGRLSRASWQTAQAPKRTPGLVLSITTFRREAAVRRSAERFARFAAQSELSDHLHLQVVDNGQSADIQPSEHVSALENANLGGAGGFARGLLEARKRPGATHCLFMDDDAAIHMEALARTWAFLAHAEDAATAVAGAMTAAAQKWSMWENGATFEGNCRPRHIGTDLRDLEEVAEMEFEAAGPSPDNFYGGWWYFAFPLDHVRHLPFPFFVRGDDVSFSLAHAFEITTLNGVTAFQDEDFADKESLQTLYLDLRSHLAHHLALPHMERSRLRTCRIPAWFFARSMMQMHYDSLEALNLAIEDVLEGPDFFARNADMADRRADLKALMREEAWREGAPPVSKRGRLDPEGNGALQQMMKYTLNGHLLPGFSVWGDRRVVPAGKRGSLHAIWGAAEVTYTDPKGNRHFTVSHSKAHAWRQGWRMLRNIHRLHRDYRRLLDEWRSGYDRLASEGFWTEALGMEVLEGDAESRVQDTPSTGSRYQ